MPQRTTRRRSGWHDAARSAVWCLLPVPLAAAARPSARRCRWSAGTPHHRLAARAGRRGQRTPSRTAHRRCTGRRTTTISHLVRRLIAAGANANAANDHGVTPLALACENGNAAIIAALLSAGARPNDSGGERRNAADDRGAVGCVRGGRHAAGARRRRQRRRTVSPADRVDVGGLARTRSHCPAPDRGGCRRPRAVARQAPHGATQHPLRRPEHREGRHRDGPRRVHAAVVRSTLGTLDTAAHLLAAGANANDEAPGGTSALVVAAHSGNGAVAAYLAEHGADVNVADAGYTALHAAILRGDLAAGPRARRARRRIRTSSWRRGRRAATTARITPSTRTWWARRRSGSPRGSESPR